MSKTEETKPATPAPQPPAATSTTTAATTTTPTPAPATPAPTTTTPAPTYTTTPWAATGAYLNSIVTEKSCSIVFSDDARNVMHLL